MKTSLLCAAAFGALSLASVHAFAQPAPTEASLQPKYGTWGFDASGEDRSIKPGDDFFAFADGTYNTTLKIPADHTRFGSFDVLGDLSEARVHLILDEAAAKVSTEAPTTVEGKVGAAYKAFMDEARVESLGQKPLARDLAEVNAVKTRGELAYIMGKAAGGVQASLFGVGIQPDDKDPNRYLIEIGQDGLGLPDPRFGERICAVIELEAGVPEPGLAEIAAHVKSQLADYKSPRNLVVVDSVGRAPNGKVDYKAVKARAMDQLGAAA